MTHAYVKRMTRLLNKPRWLIKEMGRDRRAVSKKKKTEERVMNHDESWKSSLQPSRQRRIKRGWVPKVCSGQNTGWGNGWPLTLAISEAWIIISGEMASSTVTWCPCSWRTNDKRWERLLWAVQRKRILIDGIWTDGTCCEPISLEGKKGTRSREGGEVRNERLRCG